jgi:hypothetical protein
MRCFCPLSTLKGNTVENKCNSCFYALMDRDLQAPCITCTGYSNYVKGTVYMTPSHASKTLKEAIDEWYTEGKDQLQEDFWYDVVEKPKHYMLFEEEGIEVRDVIEKLVGKLPKNTKPMFIADYVQMMQYLMRFMDKNGVEDLKKANWYLDKLIDVYESDV